MRTKDRKLQINDTLYIFRVPAETSLDPHDIIRAGRVMMIRVGIMPSVDVNGKTLGSAARSWNPQKPIEVDSTPETIYFLNSALQRTKNLIEAEEKNPGTKLPRIAVVKHRGEKIQVCNDEPRYYFIPSKTFCHNCVEPIQGITKLEINSNGKVAREFPFEPTEPASMHTNGSKKWLHERCVAKSIIIDGPYNSEQETEEHIKKVYERFDKVKKLPPPTLNAICTCGHTALEHGDKRGSHYKGEGACLEDCDCNEFTECGQFKNTKKPTTKNHVVGILKDSRVNSEFARGCAYMYLIMTN